MVQSMSLLPASSFNCLPPGGGGLQTRPKFNMQHSTLASFPVLHHSYCRLFVLQATIAVVEDWGLTLAKFFKTLSCYTNKQPPCSQILPTLEVKVVVDNNSVKSPVYDTMIDVTS